MTHRGPDAEGIYANGPATLAHRRLSILDLSDAGRQPMSNSDRTVHIVFNGEIYNYRELRDRVSHYPFGSETDTEVLLHLYEEMGTECLHVLRGMFAFAIWDETEGRMFMARDRLGQKPLFYRHDQDMDTLWFGSTIKAILADDTIRAVPDLEAIRSYLTYQYVPAPNTGFEHIKQLPPAHYATFTENDLRIDRYWDLSYGDQFSTAPSRLAARLREKIREGIRFRLRSDVPLGVFLSGGIDSSTVVALMSQTVDDPIQTYAIGFDVDEYDELDFARQVAERYNTNHTEYTLAADSMLKSLDTLVEHYEMPFGDTSALPTYHVSRLASQDITVALSGDAGDENFAGYDRYAYDRVVSVLEQVPRPLRSAGRTMLKIVPHPWDRHPAVDYPRRALEISEYSLPDSYARFVCHAIGDTAQRFWDGVEPEDEIAEIRQTYHTSDGPTRLDRLLDVDMHNYLPDDILLKVDRASMAHSLEIRSPFLDHELVQFAARIPAKYKLRGRTKKWILKRAVRDLLPDDVLNRPKQGFGVPVNEWLRGELREFARKCLNRLADRRSYHRAGIESTFEAHQDRCEDNGYYLWDLMMLEQWYERYID